MPIAHRRPHVTGQRAAHAPAGAETGGPPKDTFPRPQTHLRNDGAPEWRGRKNGVLHAGHYSAGFTLDTYAHVTTDAQLKAAQTMGSILSRAV